MDGRVCQLQHSLPGPRKLFCGDNSGGENAKPSVLLAISIGGGLAVSKGLKVVMAMRAGEPG